jgi:hypothetical protein
MPRTTATSRITTITTTTALFTGLSSFERIGHPTG